MEWVIAIELLKMLNERILYIHNAFEDMKIIYGHLYSKMKSNEISRDVAESIEELYMHEAAHLYDPIFIKDFYHILIPKLYKQTIRKADAYISHYVR